MRSFERLEDRQLLASDLSFDFGPWDGQVAAGSIGVDPYQFLDASTGYGWIGGLGEGSRVPGADPSLPQADAVDALFPEDRLAFAIENLEPGSYRGTAVVGYTGRTFQGQLDVAGNIVDVAADGAPQSLDFAFTVAPGSGLTRTPFVNDQPQTPSGVYAHDGGVIIALSGQGATISSLAITKIETASPAFTLAQRTILVDSRVSSVSFIATDTDLTLTSDTGETATFAAGTFSTVDATQQLVSGEVITPGTVIAQFDAGAFTLQSVHPTTLRFNARESAVDFARTGTSVAVMASTRGNDWFEATVDAARMNQSRALNAEFVVAYGLTPGNDLARLDGGQLMVSRTSAILDSRVHVIAFDEVTALVDQVFWLTDRDRLQFRLNLG